MGAKPNRRRVLGAAAAFGLAGVVGPVRAQFVDPVALPPANDFKAVCTPTNPVSRCDEYQNPDVLFALDGDGNAYFNRPGPRVVEALEILAELLHPGRFDFGHDGRGWIHWPDGAS